MNGANKPGDPKPSLVDGLKNFYSAYEQEVPNDDVLGQVAQEFAGRERDLWSDLISTYEGSDPPAEDLDALVVMYTNPFLQPDQPTESDEKKKPGGGGSSGVAQSADPTSLGSIVKDNYAAQLDALLLRKNNGELTQEQYLEQAKALSGNRKSELDVISSESMRLLDDQVDPKYKELEDRYLLNQDHTEQYKAAVEKINSTLPNYKEAINFLDAKLAESLGTTVEEAKIQTSLWEQGRGGSPIDAQNARAGVVDRYEDDLKNKFPGLPDSIFKKYRKSPSSVSEIDYTDLSSQDNPYRDTKQSLVDNIIEQNFPDIDKGVKQQLRREMIDYVDNKSTFDRANEKAQAALKKAGIKPPEVMMQAFESKASKLGEDYAGQLNEFDRKRTALMQSAEALYDQADAEYVSEFKPQLEGLRQSLDANVGMGAMTNEEADRHYAEKVQAFQDGRKALYNAHVEKVSRQQRNLLDKAEQLRQDHKYRLQKYAEESGLEIEGDKIKASQEYIDKYDALLKQYVSEEQMQKLKSQEDEYRSLTIEQKLSNALQLGYMDMFEGLGGGMKWLGMKEAGNFLTDISENVNSDLPLPAFDEFKWSEVTNPDWWINKGVRSLPIMANLALAGGATTSLVTGALGEGTTAVSALGKSMSLSPIGKALIAGSAGAAAMRPLESLMEAGSSYEQAIKNGKTDKEAGEAASEVFKKNMHLILTDALQLGVTFGKFPGRLITSNGGRVSASLHRLGNSMLGKGVLNFTTEGAEEVYQEWAQAKVDNPLLTFWQFGQTPAGQEAFALGGLMGVGFSIMGGSEQGQVTQVNKMIKSFLNESKSNQSGSALKVRQMQLLNSLQMLQERNVLSEKEVAQATNVINQSFDAFADTLNGDISIDWNDDAHTEYVVLGQQYRKLQAEVKNDESNPNNAVKKAQAKAISKRMVDLTMDPSASVYAIDGIPFSREDFESIVGIQPLANMISDADLNVSNDAEVIGNMVSRANPAADNTELVEQYIAESEEFNDIDGAIDAVNAEITGKRKDGDSEHLSALERKKAVLEQVKEAQQAKNLLQKYESGTLVDHINSLDDQRAISEFNAAITAMEQNGVPESDISSFRGQLPELSKKQEELTAEFEKSQEDTFDGDDRVGAKARRQELSIDQDYWEYSLDESIYESVRDSNPGLIEEIEEFDYNDIPSDLKAEFVAAAKSITADPNEVQAEPEQESDMEPAEQPVEPETAAGEVPEVETEQVPLNEKEANRIDRRIEKLKEELGAWWDSQQKLGIDAFNEERLMEDIRAASALAELAYLYIKRGVNSISEFVRKSGLNMYDENGNPNNIAIEAWVAGLKQYRSERDQRVRLDSELSKVDAFIEFFQDKDIAIKRMMQQLQQQGIQIDEDMEFYIKRELQVSKSEDKIRRFIENFIGRDTAQAGSKAVNKESFFGRLEEAGITPDDLSLYMYALHAAEYNARVKEMTQKKIDAEVNRLEAEIGTLKTKEAQEKRRAKIDEILMGLDPEFELITTGSGMTDALAAEIIDHFQSQEDIAVLEEFVKEFQETVIQGRIDMLEEAGMIDKDTAEHLRNGTSEDSDIKFEFYVPLKVKRSEFIKLNDPGFTSMETKPGSLKRIKGSARYNFLSRNNPMSQAMIDYVATIRHIEMNETNKALYRIVKNNPENLLWGVIPSRAAVRVDENGDVTQAIDLIPAEVKENSVIAIIDGKVNYVNIKPVYDKDGNVVPHPITRALKRSGQRQQRAVSALIDISRWFINIKRNLVTTYNIAFGIPNAFRDVQEAMANITTDKEELGVKKIRRKIMGNIIPSYLAIAQSPWRQAGNRLSEYYFEAKQNGMAMSWARYEGNEQQIEKYKEMVESFHKVRGHRAFPAEAWSAMANFFMGVNDVFENGTRLAVYAALRDSGVPAERSASIAKNITLNFEKKGTATNTINAFYLFANAGIQGVARGGKLVFSKKGRRVLGVIMAASFLNQMLLDLSDEEDKLDVYGDFDRDNNFFWYNPFEPDEPFRIPKPYSFVRFAANFGESAYDVVAGKTTAVNAVGRVMSNLQTVTDPVGGAQDNIVSAYTPTMFKIPVEWFMNKKWNNTPFYFVDDSGEKGSNLKTAKTAKWATSITDFLDENTDFFGTGEGMISWSPALMEYVVKDFFGGVGKEATNLFEISTEGYTINKVPIARRLYVDLDTKQELYLYRLYELLRRPNKMGIKQDEVDIARKAYSICKEKELTSKRTLSRMAKDFEKKYKVKLR